MANLAFGTRSVALDLAERDASIAAFKHPGDAMDGETSREDHITRMADLLGVVFRYLARGHINGTTQQRTWVWLHETRPDLLKGETVEAYSKRTGVTIDQVNTLRREFRETVVCGPR